MIVRVLPSLEIKKKIKNIIYKKKPNNIET